MPNDVTRLEYWYLQRSNVDNDRNNYVVDSSGSDICNTDLASAQRIIAAVNACNVAKLSNRFLTTGAGLAEITDFVRALAEDPRTTPWAETARAIVRKMEL